MLPNHQTGRPVIGSGRRSDLERCPSIDPALFQGPVPAHLLPPPAPPRPLFVEKRPEPEPEGERRALPVVKVALRPGGVRCPKGCIPAPRSHGKSRNGAQRWRCTTCLTTWTDSPKALAGNQLTAEKAEALRVALLAGNSVRASARIAGVSKETAALYAEGRTVKCPCGQDASHRGWCSYRVSQSPRRQRTLQAMRNRVVGTPAPDASTPAPRVR